MSGTDALRLVVEWLPTAFALDVVRFHVVADHPLALRWWARRPSALTASEGRQT